VPSYAAGDGREEAAEEAAQRTSQQPTSSHDAPLSTSDSDPDTDPGPQTEKRSGTAAIPGTDGTAGEDAPEVKPKTPRRARTSPPDSAAPKQED
jgi:hypothetical protein